MSDHACLSTVMSPWDKLGRCELHEGHTGEHRMTADSGRVHWRWNTGDTRPTITITGEGS